MQSCKNCFALNTNFFAEVTINYDFIYYQLAIFFIWAIVVGVHLKRAGLPKARNTEEDTEDKTEIVVKKMRTVIYNRMLYLCRICALPTLLNVQ